MNNRGWGLSEMMLLTGVVLAALIVVGIMVTINFKDNDLQKPTILPEENTNKNEELKSYEQLEQDMNNAAKEYILDINDDKQTKIIVTLKTLEKELLIEPVYDAKTNRTKCSGYVIVNKNSSGDSYEPYLKCSFKYTTKGYSAEYDE